MINRILLAVMLCSNIALCQTNSFPVSGDAEIKTGKLLLETNTWRESLLTFKDTHYTPAQLYKFQLESDGLKLRQDNTVNYQFMSGGDFVVNRGNVGIGTLQPDFKLHVKDGSGGNQLKFQRGTGVSIITQDIDKSNLYIDAPAGLLLNNGGGNVGIGTDQPNFKLHIKDGAGGNQLKFQRGIGVSIITQDFDKSNLYIDAPAGLLLNYGGGNVGIGTLQPLSRVHINANQHSPSLFALSNTLYGLNMIYHFQIESDGLKIKRDNSINYLFSTGGDFIVYNGSVQSKEVKVSVTPGTGPDYVFEPTYALPTLAETEAYIKANKHLPEVPSAKEMEANGINLSEMNMLLLKKVEELTLHLIEQQKQIDELKRKNVK